MSKHTSNFVQTLETIHSPETAATDKIDLLIKLTQLQKKLTESDLVELKQSNNPAVKDWLKMQS